VAQTGGFSPRPKVHFGLALPTGAESVAEYLDVDLEALGASSIDVDSLPDLLTPTLPAGLDVTAAAPVPEGAFSLQEAVTSCTWSIELAGLGAERAVTLVDAALASPTLMVTRERKGQAVTDDIRPAIRLLTARPSNEGSAVIDCELATQPRGLRPGELVATLDAGLEVGRLLRTSQWIERDGARWEPLPLAATAVPHGRAPCVVRRDHFDDRPGQPAGGAPSDTPIAVVGLRAAGGWHGATGRSPRFATDG
jgi:radical SAM-linked protein